MQAEGSVVMGLSSAPRAVLTVKDGMIQSSNFDACPLLTLRETPRIDVDLTESGAVPCGVGEPTTGPVGAAVANAVLALAGKRLRDLSLRL